MDKKKKCKVSEVQKSKKKKKSYTIQRADNNPPMLEQTLQHYIGNWEMQRMFEAHELMAKLYINQPGDAYELEADRIAENIISMDKNDLNEKSIDINIQQKINTTSGENISTQTESGITSLKGKGSPLDKSVKEYFEPRFGVDFGNVRIHKESNADKLARAIRARAFTIENNIVFAKGEYNPGTKQGKKLVAHELTHILQGRKKIMRSSMDPSTKNYSMALQNVLQRMKESRWDVDSLAAKLTDIELKSLKIDDRINLIHYIGNGTFVLNEDEQTILRCITTTPQNDIILLTFALKRNKAVLLRILHNAIDFKEYKLFQEAIKLLTFAGLSPQNAYSQMQNSIEFPWADPGLIEAMYNVRFYYEKVALKDDGKIHVTYWTNFAFMGMKTVDDLILDPFQIIAVRFYHDEEYVGTKEGDVMFMPAINLIALHRNQFKKEMALAVDVALLFMGGTAIFSAASKAGKIIAAIELALALADFTIREFRSKIAKTEEGRAFLKFWDIVNTLIAIYTIARIVMQLPDIFRLLKSKYKDFKNIFKATSTIDELDDLKKLENKIDEIIDNAEEAKKYVNNKGKPDKVKDTTVDIEPRKNIKDIPTTIRTRSGIVVDIPDNQLTHVLEAHTVENFNPISRLDEIGGEDLSHITSFFKPRSITNKQELYTMLKQFLSGKNGKIIRSGMNNSPIIKIRNMQCRIWIGPKSGGGLKFNSIYPANSPFKLTKQEIINYADEIKNGIKNLNQVRLEILKKFI